MGNAAGISRESPPRLKLPIRCSIPGPDAGRNQQRIAPAIETGDASNKERLQWAGISRESPSRLKRVKIPARHIIGRAGISRESPSRLKPPRPARALAAEVGALLVDLPFLDEVLAQAVR